MTEQDVSSIGMVFMTTGTLWWLVIAVFAFSFGRRLKRTSHAAQQLQRTNGILFIVLGLKLATANLKS